METCAARLRMNVHGLLARGISQMVYSPALTSRPSSLTSWLNVTRVAESAPRVPDGVPLDERRVAKEHAATSDGTSVHDGNVGERHRLVDAATLAERISLRATRRGTKDNERRYDRAGCNGGRCHVSTIALIP